MLIMDGSKATYSATVREAITAQAMTIKPHTFVLSVENQVTETSLLLDLFRAPLIVVLVQAPPI